MNLAQLKQALSKLRNCEVSVRYVDILGTSQTVPIDRVVEEIQHTVEGEGNERATRGQDRKPVRRVILVVN